MPSQPRGRRRPSIFVTLLAPVALLLATGLQPRPAPPGQGLLGQDSLADSVRYQDFVGAEICGECHEQQYQTWSGSTHGRAGGTPSDRLITPFDGRPLRFADAIVRPIVTGDGSHVFAIELRGDTLTLPVTGVIGGGHMVGGGTQGFVAAYPDGTLRFVPFDYSRSSDVWFCNTRRGWLPIDESIALADCRDWPPSRILGDAALMENCQSCHGSQIQLSYDPVSVSYETRVKSLRINCESCHGPGAKHVALARSGGIASSPNISIDALNALTPDASLDVCFQCHAVKTMLQPGYLPGESLQSHYSLKLPILASDPFLPDGRLRIFAYQLNHIASDCYLSGSMTCLDCHDAHSSAYRDIYGMPLESRFSDGQCLSCHPSKSDNVVEHTRHASDSPGSQCVSCHMPYRQHPNLGTQIQFARSDHTIAIPRPGFDESLGVVSACRLCHEDRSVADLAAQTRAWYGEIKPHRRLVTALVQARGGSANPAALLVPDERDPMAQVAALGRFITAVGDPFLADLAPSDKAALLELAAARDIDVKSVALAALAILAPDDADVRRTLDTARSAVGSSADDVRIRWVSALVIFAGEMTGRNELASAVRTLRLALDVMPDHAISLYDIGKLYMRIGDWGAAERSLERALEIADVTPLNAWMINPNRALLLVNLGLTRDQMGQPDRAAATYRLAIDVDPREAMAHFYLATYYQSRGDLELAVQSYESAITARPQLVDAYVLLASAQRDLGRLDDAVATLDALLQQVPDHPEATQMRQDLIRVRGRG